MSWVLNRKCVTIRAMQRDRTQGDNHQGGPQGADSYGVQQRERRRGLADLSRRETAASSASLGIVQTTCLDYLDTILRQHWNLGQNILLCWCLDDQGIKLLQAPHYFLGKFTASLNDCDPVDRLDALNGRFVRQLVSGSRRLSAEDFHGTASRLQLEAIDIALPVPLSDGPGCCAAVDSLFKRYSINYVKSRAVLLFDIVNFSLASPFEQTSQLNSLSYSLNSAHNKLLKRNIEINFSRTTTGDGYYVWNHDVSPRANLELFQFMLLVIADNAIAQRAASCLNASVQSVPKIRSGFHIGSHFEFYQVEGLNPSMNSFIVGDVTIELARMLDLAGSGQIFIGEFDTVVPTSNREGAYLVPANSQHFVERIAKQMTNLQGITLSGEQIESIYCFLTGVTGASGGQSARSFRITDKHGRSRNAYNLRINIRTDNSNKSVILGVPDNEQPKRLQRRAGDLRVTGNLRRYSERQNRTTSVFPGSDD